MSESNDREMFFWLAMYSDNALRILFASSLCAHAPGTVKRKAVTNIIIMTVHRPTPGTFGRHIADERIVSSIIELSSWGRPLHAAAPIPGVLNRNLLSHTVVSLSLFLQQFDVGSGQHWRLDLEGQLVELAGEAERHLIIVVVDRRAGVGTDIEVLVPLQDEWDR